MFSVSNWHPREVENGDDIDIKTKDGTLIGWVRKPHKLWQAFVALFDSAGVESGSMLLKSGIYGRAAAVKAVEDYHEPDEVREARERDESEAAMMRALMKGGSEDTGGFYW